MGELKIVKNQVGSVSASSRLAILAYSKYLPLGVCEQMAQEGYHSCFIRLDSAYYSQDVSSAAEWLSQDTNRAFGFISYEAAEEHIEGLKVLSSLEGLKAVIHYTPATQSGVRLILRGPNGAIIPAIFNVASSQEALQASLIPFMEVAFSKATNKSPSVSMYTYPLVQSSPSFALSHKMPAVQDEKEAASPVDLFVRSATNLAYSRSLELLRRQLGPWFNLEKLWEQHCNFEFKDRDAPKTMSTMVSAPYVNHIPVMTGGTGYHDLVRFYKYHFMQSSPPDTEIVPISRTVGADRLVDEFLFRFTHTTEVDYILPGVKPTGKMVEIPMIGVIAFRGDKLTFEHLYWDQASTLVQIGLLDPTGLPVGGSDVARKMTDPFGMPSNGMIERWNETLQLPE